MNRILEIQFSGWTATPRLPFVLSGNALCMPVPSYSTILGIIGCCLGRIIAPNQVQVGYKYSYEDTAIDIETRRRLQFNGKKIKSHDKGSDAYQREFHINPRLTIWIDRIDWKPFFENPIGTPSLGQSQDLLKIGTVSIKEIEPIPQGELTGCMIPFDNKKVLPGQIIQLAEAYQENEGIGSGRSSIRSTVFQIIHPESKIKVEHKCLYHTKETIPTDFYLHSFYE